MTALAVKEEGGLVLLSNLRWTTTADYETITILADSLKAIGQRMPITVNYEGEVIRGKKRCEAARRLGWTKIEAEVQE